jgi:hypothetical protein
MEVIPKNDSISIHSVNFVMGNAGYAWEAKYKHTWDLLYEDGSGALELGIKRQKTDQKAIQRGIIRQLCVCIDSSSQMSQQDLPPNRLVATINTGLHKEATCQISIRVL